MSTNVLKWIVVGLLILLLIPLLGMFAMMAMGGGMMGGGTMGLGLVWMGLIAALLIALVVLLIKSMDNTGGSDRQKAA
jgi:uncharacterized membrane protein